ncbi:iron-containing alcohol dehydrogenase [Clostridium sp.]|uniref:iron-containing alcohol dehydrogenase n=1 Tax=Clostridium sp. TaxID=1506 RepID=UPI003F353E74
MNFKYYMPTKLLFGKGQLDNLHKENLPGDKALIVTSAGNSVKKYGYLERLERQLDLAGVQYVLFDKILANPIKPHVMEGAQAIKDTGCDFVIGLGGGSSIDSAKSIAVMATNEGDYWDYISGGTGKGKPVKNDPLPIVAITTTAGTGTEVDPWTVITKEATNEKIGFGYDKTFPVLAVVDPDLMVTVPPMLTAYQGFDALFHSTEGYINNTSYVLSDMYALKSIELIGKSLETAVKNGADEDARADVALANTLSGLVESTSGCTSEHSIEHALSAFHPEIVHGAGLIMISRAYYTHLVNVGACDEKMIEMAKALGKKDAKIPMDFVTELVALQEACGVANLRMSDYGIEKEDLEKYVINARETMGGLFEVDPVQISNKDVLWILEKSYK